MSRGGDLTLDWGGDPERAFRLGIGQVKKLQEKTGAGPMGVAARCMISLGVLRAMRAGDYEGLSRIDVGRTAEKAHLIEVHLQGLLGAGVPAPEAQQLVREWVEERPDAESLPSAFAICMAAVMGPEDEQLGEVMGRGATPNPSPMDGSPSPASMEPEPS